MTAGTGGAWDTSKLTAVPSGQRVLRAIDPDDIQGWNEVDQRWEIAKSAMMEDHLIPGPKSGHGWSVFVERLLEVRCNASRGKELSLLQYHAKGHAGCYPTWEEGIVVSVDTGEFLSRGHGVGESPGDCPCTQIRDAHASVWKTPAWTKGLRKQLLNVLGASFVHQDATRDAIRLAASSPSVPPGQSGNGGPVSP